MVSSSNKRRAVKYAVEEGLGRSAVACRALGLPRSTYYRVSQISEESLEMQKEILRLSEKHPRYGYRRITAMMRQDGCQINEKRALRVRREAGFKVRKKQRRARRIGLSTARRSVDEFALLRSVVSEGACRLSHEHIHSLPRSYDLSPKIRPNSKVEKGPPQGGMM